MFATLNVYPDLSRDFAMSIGGEMSVERIGRHGFEKFAEECAMSPKLVLARLDSLAARIADAAEKLAEELNSAWSSPVYAEILRVIDAQVERIANTAVKGK